VAGSGALPTTSNAKPGPYSPRKVDAGGYAVSIEPEGAKKPGGLNVTPGAVTAEAEGRCPLNQPSLIDVSVVAKVR